MKPPKVLLVDSKKEVIIGYKEILSAVGIQTDEAQSLMEAKCMFDCEQYSAVLLEIILPDGNAIDWIAEIHVTQSTIPIIVITENVDLKTAIKAVKFGAFNYLIKPVHHDDLLLNLKHLEINNYRDEVIQPVYNHSAPYFGSSPGITKTVQYAEVASQTNTVVLLQGETGTGKGILARWIHDHSSRKSEAFVEVNCSSLKGELLRSELFGHTKGAFTSAIKDRAGLIEVVDGGTLFLDEIGDMDLEVQAQLLKTIEEKSFRRIGENRLRTSNFRLVCATNRDLTQATQNGCFRKDLYYRICIFPINLPPLRERREDIPDLVKNILLTYNYLYFPINESISQLLQSYSWPGNIRELRNVLERALLLAQGKELDIENFPVLQESSFTHQEVNVPIKIEQEIWDLDIIEMRHILRALKYFNSDKYETSAALGISLSSLYRKLDKYQNNEPT
jgi:DNA-binding NtrC family response regulator